MDREMDAENVGWSGERDRLCGLDVFFVQFLDEFFDVEFFDKSCFPILEVRFDAGTQLSERINPVQQFAPKLLLRCLWQVGGFRHCQFKCLHHVSLPRSLGRVDNRGASIS
jgi:hypothetical protein